MVLVLVIVMLSAAGYTHESSYHANWFASQKPPEKVAQVTVHDSFSAEHMLAQSISGLSARAVNEKPNNID